MGYAPISNWKNTQPGQSIGKKRYLEILDDAIIRSKYQTNKYLVRPLGKCGATGLEFNAGSHRDFVTPECGLMPGHEGSHHDHVWQKWWG
jgi:hypothetical protein